MSRRKSTGVADPSSAIFIGNSFFYYNNGINNHLTQLIAAAAPARPWRSTLARMRRTSQMSVPIP